MIGSVLLLVVAAVIGLLVAAKQVFRRRKVTGPVCGACGYSVTGLTGMTCPECGGDLRTVGILTPATAQAAGVVAGAMIFTLLLGFIATVATSAMESVVPVRHLYRRQVGLGPVSSGYRNVLVRTSRTGWGGSFTPAAVTIELEPSGAKMTALPPKMTVHSEGGYEFTTGSSRILGHGNFGEGAVLEWLKAAGIDTTEAGIQRKAARIAAEVGIAARSGRSAMDRSSGGSSSSSSSSGSGPSDVFQTRSTRESGDSYSSIAPSIGMVLFWVAVWIWGLWYLVSRRAGRRVAKVKSLDAAAM